MSRANLFPALQALLAAVLFGASAPLAKLLLGETAPVMLAGLLYLGSGIGVLLVKLAQGWNAAAGDTQITRSDWKWLLGAVIATGLLLSEQYRASALQS